MGKRLVPTKLDPLPVRRQVFCPIRAGGPKPIFYQVGKFLLSICQIDSSQMQSFQTWSDAETCKSVKKSANERKRKSTKEHKRAQKSMKIAKKNRLKTTRFGNSQLTISMSKSTQKTLFGALRARCHQKHSKKTLWGIFWPGPLCRSCNAINGGRDRKVKSMFRDYFQLEDDL